jgi:tRNA G18 (ribose-2'-O)-methylase SpoU
VDVAIVRIEDPLDHRLDDYRNIPDPELIAYRGVFVAEGRLVVGRLLAESGLTTRSLMVTEAALAALEEPLAGRPDLPVYVVLQSVMNGVAGFNIHRGCLAIGERPADSSWRNLAAGARRLVMLEHVTNADNVGGVFRNAAAFGADAVLLGPTCTDPLYRKAIRTSMGAALVVPFARVDSCPEAIVELRAKGFGCVALTPSARSDTLRICAERLMGRRMALVLGHEGHGLTDDALAACDYSARIPMASAVDSLNVAAAAAIALYELSALGPEA